MRPESDTASIRRSIERHYDALALLYRLFWGEHLHHGLWLAASDTPRAAQEQLVAHLAGQARVSQQEDVLDVGCGYGASARWLSAHYDCRVVGITLSRAQAAFARRRTFRSELTARPAILRADASALPFARPSFDLVWIVECLEHISDKRQLLHDLAALLRPGGRLALCTWQRGLEVPAHDPWVRAVCDAFLCPSLASEQECRDWCAQAGLELLHSEDLTERTRATWDVLLKRLSRRWLQPLRRLLDSETRAFLDGFPVIAEAYDLGRMRYGLVVATRT